MMSGLHFLRNGPGCWRACCILVIGLAAGPGPLGIRVAAAQPPTAMSVLQQRQSLIVKLFGAGVGNLDSYGSAVVISADGHVMTVWNHLINVGYLTAVTADGRRFSVKVVGTDAATDLAILKLESPNRLELPYLDLAQAGEAGAGDSVLAFSNMFHVATGNEPVSVLHGVVAAKTPIQADQGRWKFPIREPVYVIDAITNNSGSTGGLLTLSDGTAIGLIGREVRHSDNRMWINYAVPLPMLRPVVERILSGRPPETPVTGSERPAMLSDRQISLRFGMTLVPDVLENTPAYIDQISSGSPAASAALQRRDLIVLLNDQAITGITDVRRQLAAVRTGQRVTVTVNRNQQLITSELRVP